MATNTLAAVDSTALGVVSGAFRSYGPQVIQGLIIVSTISGQSIIGKLTFECPCAYPLNIYHSCTFIFGPALALFMFAILINPNTWKLVHGCCHRTSKSEHPFGVACLYWLQIISQSGIAPVAWLFVAFLNGSYYTCMKAGSFCNIKDTRLCDNSTALQEALSRVPLMLLDVDENICPLCVCSLDPISEGYLRSQSQVIAWGLIIAIGTTALISICVIRMCDKYTYVQNSYVQMYREEEKRIFEEIAKFNARKYAEANSNMFFEREKHSKEDWDIISALPSIENPYIFRSRLKKKPITAENWEYTKLQKWINEYREKHPIQRQETPQGFTNLAEPMVKEL
uniref:Calcium homeostasis modulator protein n=1 Tax=Panagrolaimus sp. PS1159 TaxID=55785 RepID=A0AC35G148_9BILA